MLTEIDADCYIILNPTVAPTQLALIPALCNLVIRHQLACAYPAISWNQLTQRFWPRISQGTWAFSRSLVKLWSRSAKTIPCDIGLELRFLAHENHLELASLPAGPPSLASSSQSPTLGQILGQLWSLHRRYRPYRFFRSLALVCLLVAASIFFPSVYFQHVSTSSLPLLLLCSSLLLLAVLSLAYGAWRENNRKQIKSRLRN